MNYWLLKTEPTSYGIDDLKKDGKTLWTGVRNYQARNFLRDGMKAGDECLIYHSSSNELGVYGTAKITKERVIDPTQFDTKDYHFDPKSKKDAPMWYAVDIQFGKKFKNPISLGELKANPKFSGMMATQKGSRLSVQPITKQHYDEIVKISL